MITACGPHYDVKEFREIKDGKWYYKDSLSYDFTIKDTSKIYNLYLQVEHADTFAYENLYVKIHTIFPNNQRLEQQVSLELANKAGIWNEESNGGECRPLIALQEGAFFNQIGKYKLTIEQFMRFEPVLGVKKIGFLLQNTGEDKSSFFSKQKLTKKKVVNK